MKIRSKNCSYQNFDYTDFSWEDLSGVDFSGSSLVCCNFRGANCTGANFSGATCDGSIFESTTCLDTLFIKTNLRNTNFRGTIITGSDFTGSIFEFTCWPLWRGSVGAKIDKKIACQLLFYAMDAMQSIQNDPDIDAVLDADCIKKLTNQYNVPKKGE